MMEYVVDYPKNEYADIAGEPPNTLHARTTTNASTFREENNSKRIVERLFSHEYLDRGLKRPQITGIAFSGTIGIGLFLSSGEIIGLGGSLGCMLGFVCAGFIVIGVMRSLAELVSINPTFSALITYPKVFVDDALGFAVGVNYWLAQCIDMACLTSAAARVAKNFFPYKNLSEGKMGGIIVGLLILTLLSNVCGVRFYGNIERVVKWAKLIILLGLAVLMILINVGVGGYPTDSTTRNLTDHGLTPYFSPFGFNSTSPDTTEAANRGIPGTSGRFLAVWTCITLAVFACMGGDIVILAAGEAKYPRKDLPAVTRFMYLAPIGFYILNSMLVGFNVNYAEPGLSHIYRTSHSTNSPSPSPFIIAIKYSSLAPRALSVTLSACFLFCAYTAANTALFASSRALFGLSRTYGTPFIQKWLGKTDNRHTPLPAILVSSLFGLLAFLGLADPTFDQPILSLSAFFTGSIGCVYASECLAYIRYWQGHQRLQAVGQLSRESEQFRAKHYTPSWQPVWAIVGLIGSLLIVIFTGWPAIYIMSARRGLDGSQMLKPNKNLAWDILGAYSGPFIFFTLFAGYKLFRRTTFKRFEDFMDQYHQPDFENEDDVQAPPQRNWKGIIKEVWSFIK